jgi:hypothetical protein
MTNPLSYRLRALDCARRAREATDREEQQLLFQMAEAWSKLAAVEADVSRQADAEWGSPTLH